MVIYYHLACFTEFPLDVDAQYRTGYSLAAVLFTCVAGNVIFVGRTLRRAARAAQRAADRKLRARYYADRVTRTDRNLRARREERAAMCEANEAWDAGNVEDPADTVALAELIQDAKEKASARARAAGRLASAAAGPMTGPGGSRLHSILSLRRGFARRGLKWVGLPPTVAEQAEEDDSSGAELDQRQTEDQNWKQKTAKPAPSTAEHVDSVAK